MATPMPTNNRSAGACPGLGTLAIHAGQSPDPSTGAVMTPIYATSTYVQSSPGEHQGFEYSRSHNPTRFAYERCVAALEGGTRGFAFASGLAATSTILEMLDTGSHVIAMDDVYGGTYRLFERVRRRSAGLDFSWVDLTDAAAFEAAIRPETKMVWIETPTNPLLKLVDIARIAAIARKRGLTVVVDNTFSSPILQRPLEHGAHIVMHSATKYLNGHSDMVGGMVVVGDDAELAEQMAFLQNAIGGVQGPFDSFLALRGLKTLHLRMKAHCENAQALAEWLQGHPAVEKVIYPGLKSHPQHDARQAPDGRLRRHGLHRPQGRAGCRQALLRAHRTVRAGRVARRRGKPGQPPGDHDACLRAGRAPRAVGAVGCAGAVECGGGGSG